MCKPPAKILAAHPCMCVCVCVKNVQKQKSVLAVLYLIDLSIF